MITKEVAALMALRVYEEGVQDYNLPVDPNGWSKLVNPLSRASTVAEGSWSRRRRGRRHVGNGVKWPLRGVNA